MANLDDDKGINKDDADILGEEAGADGEEEEDSEDSDWDLESDIEE